MEPEGVGTAMVDLEDGTGTWMDLWAEAVGGGCNACEGWGRRVCCFGHGEHGRFDDWI